jgi:peptidoglycan/LPS O-acetylase OafA/YrhL
METRRVHYIDWLRVLAVLLLFPFHAGRVFNYGDPFYAKSPIESIGISYLLGFINAWHMPLLFMLAGASTYFALKRRTIRQYAGERSLRLLVPLAFGIFFIVPPQTWLGARTNAGYTGSFAEYIMSGAFLDPTNLFGRGDYYGGLSPAHLWFIMFLWILSMVSIPVLGWGRTERGDSALTRLSARIAHPFWWPLIVVAILVGDALPDISGKNPFYFLVFFLLGYLFMHQDAFATWAEKLRLPALGAGAIIVAVTVALWRFGDSLPDPSVARALWTYLELTGGWLVVVGLWGYGRRFLDQPSPRLAYLAEASYPVYILHQTVIVVIGFYLVLLVPWPVLGWPLLMPLAAAVTFVLYEGVRRVGPLRFLFGMRPRRAAAGTPSRR